MNAAIEVAAEPFRAQVRVLDMAELFTPGRALPRRDDAGRPQADRARPGRHPPERDGAGLAADKVLEAVERDFGG